MPRAARMGDAVVCPDSGHSETRIKRGESSVLIGGKPAARDEDDIDCSGRDHPSAVHAGNYRVLIGGRLAARVGDGTFTVGMIVEGCPTVWIDESSFDDIAMAIERIRLAPFGHTDEGKRAIARLENLRGRTAGAPPKARCRLEPREAGGGEAGAATFESIVVYADRGDLNEISSTLVHEQVHERQPDPSGYSEGEWRRKRVAREREAWDRELAFYEEQKAQGAYTENSQLEAYANAPDRNAFLDDLYNRKP